MNELISRPLRALVVIIGCAAAAVGGANAAVMDGPAKRPDIVVGTAGMAPVHTAGELRTLLVTFDGPVPPVTARAALAGLGVARPVVPEAGIWSLAVNERAAAVRARARQRPGVIAADWSLVRSGTRVGSGEQPAVPDEPAPPALPTPAPEPTDPLFTQYQWGLASDRGAPGWNMDLTAAGADTPVRIAVLDTGVDPAHPEWRGRLIHPRNIIARNADAADRGLTGHGTHVAGIAAAPADGVGIVGVAPAAVVIPVRIARSDGRSTDAAMMAGIRWAVLHGARVVNISAGGPDATRAFQRTILWATSRGALIVASVGNDGLGPSRNQVNYPAGYPRVLGVSAQCDRSRSSVCPTPYGRARFANTNRSVDLIAPGVNILSTVPRRVPSDVREPGYAMKDGTSMAAPYVTGVAAIVQAANGNRLSPHQLLRQLQRTALGLGVRAGGRNNLTGYGVVDPVAAVLTDPPADDVDEVNDDIGWLKRPGRQELDRPRVIEASIDADEDPDDVYAVRLRRGQLVDIVLRYPSGRHSLYLWGPGTRTVATTADNVRRNLLEYRVGTTRTKRIRMVARRSGIHYVNVYARAGRADYRATVTIRRV